MAVVSHDVDLFITIRSLNMKFHVYKDTNNEWRWRLKATNGNILADSGEGYSAKADCLAGIQSVKGSANSQVVEE
jgi:uncharacterized protein YegP (UPF0339 family)